KAALAGGAPIVPGLEGAATDVKTFAKKADEVGYPVLIKASAGGGGKGMRRVDSAGELPDALEGAAREAAKAFGDNRIYLEKYLVNPRHIEVQVFGDTHGAVAHLFERECSIQRRHQKIIEETPSAALTPELREQICEAAVQVAQAARYYSAGTVEFLYDDSGAFYFLEMNTRLQVEHPITELVTGLDLVAEQIRVAAGEKLSAELLGATQRGHAIECRIYAEDAENNFFPSSGVLRRYVEPSGPGLRIDSGVAEGSVVGIDYDPILAKVVTYGETREAARLRMIDALKRYTILGVKTCNRYLIDILERPEFIAGKTHTAFIDAVMPEIAAPSEEEIHAAVAASALALETTVQRRPATGAREEVSVTPWETLGGWRLGEER
ncbi:MAG TPA: acetyl-CoA carboxylase biotin carboxylase subunit, partial [candidate division Zixibacteria bacterium]|nr:acetyl-CoA carboxylase biotin carboxylase subunit [candidate division Zixibacteria bacterium]